MANHKVVSCHQPAVSHWENRQKRPGLAIYELCLRSRSSASGLPDAIMLLRVLVVHTPDSRSIRLIE